MVDSTAGTTTTTSYVGRLETYSITTGNQPTAITTTDYVSAGKVLAESVNGTLSYLATSYQGSVVEALDSTGNVGVTASQLYVPYGGIRYQSGALPTDEGYTGQRRDASTGLDYYGARYYDPTLGQFTSADTVADGSNRYGYVEGNPTTATDPSGHRMCAASCDGNEVSNLSPEQWEETYYTLAKTVPGAALTMALWSPDAWKQARAYAYYHEHSNDLDLIVGQQAVAYRQGRPSNDWNASPDMMQEYGELTGMLEQYLVASGGGSVQDMTVGDIRATAFPTLLTPRVSETPSGPPLSRTLEGDGAKGAGGVCSFAAETPVATPDGGEQAIGSLKVGDQVEAYDPTTGKPSAQTVEHVWVNHDHDLIDLTLQSDDESQAQPDETPTRQRDVAVASHGLRAPPRGAGAGAHTTNETIHTTSEHPWLTAERGWVPAGALYVGEQVVRLDGGTATVISVRSAPGTATRYNLTVSHLHTFAVGAGRYVVHNFCGPTGPDSGPRMAAPGGGGGGGGGGGTTIVGTPQGHDVPVPANWTAREADTGQGVVFQQPGAAGNANSVRIMDPTPRYPEGYIRYYNGYGQPLDRTGRPGDRAATHIPLDTMDNVPGYYDWLQRFGP